MPPPYNKLNAKVKLRSWVLLKQGRKKRVSCELGSWPNKRKKKLLHRKSPYICKASLTTNRVEKRKEKKLRCRPGKIPWGETSYSYANGFLHQGEKPLIAVSSLGLPPSWTPWPGEHWSASHPRPRPCAPDRREWDREPPLTRLSCAHACNHWGEDETPLIL